MMTSADEEPEIPESVRRYLRDADPVPLTVVAAAQAAFEFRDLDAQIAELLADSAMEPDALVAVRGTADRLLTFGVGDRFIELQIRAGTSGCAIHGYLVPSAPGAMEIESTAVRTTVILDERGRFRVERVPVGPVRLRIDIPGARPLVTPWLAL